MAGRGVILSILTLPRDFLMFFFGIFRILNKHRSHNDENDANRNVDERNSELRNCIAGPTVERRANYK